MDLMLLEKVLLGLFIATIGAIAIAKARGKKFKLPPGPFAFPIFGNWLQVGDDLNHSNLTSMARKFGEIFLLRMGQRNLVVVSSPNLAREVLFTQGVEFGSRTRNVVFDIFTGEGQDMVFTVYGDHWRKMRRIMTVPFFTNKVVQQYRFGWEDETKRVVDDVKANPKAATEGIVLRRRLQLMMYNNLYRIMFDRRFESEDDPLFLKLKALNGERSRLAQSFEYNYGDFIPILRPFLRGYLKKCQQLKDSRIKMFKDYFVDDRRKLLQSTSSKSEQQKCAIDHILEAEKKGEINEDNVLYIQSSFSNHNPAPPVSSTIPNQSETMASTTAVTAAVSLPSSKSSSLLLPTRVSSPSSDRVSFLKKTSRSARNAGRLVAVRAQVTTTETGSPAKVEKVHKKNVEGVTVNKFKPKNPYIGRCLLNTKITGDDAPGETWHMVFSTEDQVPYREGQSIGIIADGVDKKGKPHKLRLYSIASSAIGDFGDSKSVSLCVKRLVYTNDAGEEVKGVCSNYLCDLKPGDEVKITGPIGKEMLMPVDPNATVIMLGTGTGIAPFRAFLWKMFFEKHEDYKFNGLAWLFLGVPTSSSLLYKEEFEKMKEKAPDNFRLDFAVSREQTNAKGEKMYIQTRMAEYAEELWELLKKDNTYVYMCGLKGMEKGIDDIMVSLAAKDGIDWMQYKRDLKKAEQWNVEVY